MVYKFDVNIELYKHFLGKKLNGKNDPPRLCFVTPKTELYQ